MSFKIDVVFLDVMTPLIISCTGAYKRLKIQCLAWRRIGLAGLNPKQLACFQIRLPLLFGDLLFDLFQHNVIKCISADSDIMYISSWACSNANLHTCTLLGQQRKPMNPSKATCPSVMLNLYKVVLYLAMTHSATQTRAQNIQTNAPSLFSTRRMCWQNCWLRKLYRFTWHGPLGPCQVTSSLNEIQGYCQFTRDCLMGIVCADNYKWKSREQVLVC